jgi:hypothetical protein
MDAPEITGGADGVGKLVHKLTPKQWVMVVAAGAGAGVALRLWKRAHPSAEPAATPEDTSDVSAISWPGGGGNFAGSGGGAGNGGGVGLPGSPIDSTLPESSEPETQNPTSTTPRFATDPATGVLGAYGHWEGSTWVEDTTLQFDTPDATGNMVRSTDPTQVGHPAAGAPTGPFYADGQWWTIDYDGYRSRMAPADEHRLGLRADGGRDGTAISAATSTQPVPGTVAAAAPVGGAMQTLPYQPAPTPKVNFTAPAPAPGPDPRYLEALALQSRIDDLKTLPASQANFLEANADLARINQLKASI